MNSPSKENPEAIPEKTNFLNQWHRNWIGRATAFFALTTLAFVLWQIFQWGGEPYRTLVNDSAQALTAVAAFLVTWVLSRHKNLDDETRRAWRTVALAYFFFATAQTLWFYYRQMVGVDPFPSFVDAGYFLFYPLMLWALLSFPTAEQFGRHRRKFWLDVACVMIAGSTVVWYFIILPTLSKNTDAVKNALNIAYIVGDMVLFLGIITILMRRPTENVRRALFVIAAGLFNLFFADISFAYVTLYDIEHSGPLVTFWVTGAFLLIVASYFQYQTAENIGESNEEIKDEIYQATFTWLPYAAIAVGYGVLLLSTRNHWSEPLGVVVFSALFLTAIVVLRQITAVKENIRLHEEQATRESESHFRTLIENSSDIVMIFDLKGNITYQSPSVERILGYEQDALVGKSGFAFVHSDDIPIINNAFKILTQNPLGEVMRECRFRHKDGSWLILEGIGKFLRDEETGTCGILLNARDINERKALESKLKHQAFHDPLTNLANRLLFRSRVDEALRENHKTATQVAVLFLDLDDFKNINDTLGHDAGDKLLVEFTEKLRFCVRAKDTVARFGGDEFAILIEGQDIEEKAVTVARRILEKLCKPFQINNSEVKIGISIGIAFNNVKKLSADDLLRNADVAMYIAKGKGKNRFIVFESEMHRTLLSQIELEKDLRHAIADEKLTLNYQPIMNLQTGHITGMETLVRWHHPHRGFIPPNDFIALAEQSGLIIPLGRWILFEACNQSKRLFELYGKNLSVTINISGKQIEHPSFVKDLADVLEKVRINPENIVLELTETTMMENTEEILEILHKIKSLGIRFAIDDFGTGYSSLSYLQQFPIDILKIDRTFVDGIEFSTQKNAVARTIINLSETLQLSTVAEGIETIEQAEILQELGCELGQGYFFSRPIDIEQFEKLLITINTGLATYRPMTEDAATLVSKSIN